MILQTHIPYDIEAARRLPGTAPFPIDRWIDVDSAYDAQMAERRRLLSDRPDEVLADIGKGRDGASELLDMVLAQLAQRPGFVMTGDAVTGPDGVTTPIDRAVPLRTLGQIVQEDFCILDKRAGAAEHILEAAVLCFPASWRLAEKIGRPLTGVHEPVEDYDADIARRVQRLFDGIRVGAPLWRCNVLYYDDAALFQPRSSQQPRPLSHPRAAPFIRSERQCLVRLPQTGAVVFSIHTYVIEANAKAGNSPRIR